MDDRSIARWRMRTLRLTGRRYPSAPAVVEGLLAVQAENHAQASWAVATRAPGLDEAEFRRLVDAGEILRTHVLRPTWHFVRPDDIRWLVELTAPRVRRLIPRLQRSLDLDDRTLRDSESAIVGVLAENGALGREELGRRLRERGLPAEGQRLGVMMVNVELAALVCSGPTQDGQQTYALLEERAPRARRVPQRLPGLPFRPGCGRRRAPRSGSGRRDGAGRQSGGR